MCSDENRGLDYSEKGTKSTKRLSLKGPVYMEWGTPVKWGWFLLFSRSGGHKTKETYPTRPGSPLHVNRVLHDVGNSAQDAFTSWPLKLNSS